MSINLDDINQTVFYIPFTGEGEPSTPPTSPLDYRDLPNGYDLRLQAYKVAREECLHHVRSIIHALQAPVADAVLHAVQTAYEDVLPGLPYAELPVICVTAPSVGPTFLNDVTSQLEGEKECLVTHLWPSECTNVMSGMKTLISGFVDRQIDGHTIPHRKSDVLLAPYDINLLTAWYNANELDDTLKLIVVLHEFELFDPVVMQDVFEICSAHLLQLPLTFLLSLSSPPVPSYLHTAYPRSTLSLLRVTTFSVPTGETVLEEILMQTYFDPSHAPSLTLGPSMLEFIASYFTRHNASLDNLLTVLQLCHLKHFDEPLTILSHDTFLGTNRADLAAQILTEPNSFSFLDSLFARLHRPDPDPSEDHTERWRTESIPSLMEGVDKARASFHTRARNLRVGFQLLRMVQGWMKKQGYKSAESDLTVIEMMGEAMKGRLGRQGKWVGTMIKKLGREKLEILLHELSKFFANLSEDDLQYEDDLLVGAKVGNFIDILAKGDNDDTATAKEVGKWFTDYIVESMVRLEEDCLLWDVWYTGMTPFPNELINPNVRASIISGLMDPLAYVDSSDSTSRKNEEEEIYDLPDTSILFRRYLDCGKMINVWDWFESFVLVCEGQRERERESRSPSKGRGKRRESRSPKKGKGKEKQKEADEELDEESWKLAVQARFMRALHELDYIGFIKHTGRKADHVVRTVWLGEH